jgi:hypothetical protein
LVVNESVVNATESNTNVTNTVTEEEGEPTIIVKPISNSGRLDGRQQARQILQWIRRNATKYTSE